MKVIIQGTMISVIGLHLRETYSDLLAGSTRDPIGNKWIIESCLKKAQTIWGEQNYLIIRPQFLDRSLPGTIFYSFLKSDERREKTKKNEKIDWSMLVVIFFADINLSQPLQQILEENLSNIDYLGHCKYYSYNNM